MLGLSGEVGALKAGLVADVTVLDILDGRFELRDNSGDVVVTPQMIVPGFALKDGRRFDADSPLIPAPVQAAA
ncbi:MAG: hypothetical protein WDN49_16680 [Acetobacteraceae bacterium]